MVERIELASSASNKVIGMRLSKHSFVRYVHIIASTKLFLVNLVQHLLRFLENPLHLIQQGQLLLSSLSLMHLLRNRKVLVLNFVEFPVWHGLSALALDAFS